MSWHQTLLLYPQNVEDYQIADLSFNFNSGSSKKSKVLFAYTDFRLVIQKHSVTSVAEYLRPCFASVYLESVSALLARYNLT